MEQELVPLAERLRPDKLSEVIGQEQLTGKGKLLEQLVASKRPLSLIFWGPPGSGKTTLARIIARATNADFVELSAVTASKKDVLNVIERAKINLKQNHQTILFIDEIHRFNKAQQDAFLPYVENGTISLIGATTENPSFEVISPLLSRSRVVVLEPLSEKSIIKILTTAIKSLKLKENILGPSSINLIAQLSGGDARSALNLLELSLEMRGDKPISTQVVLNAAQKRVPLHDKAGESHYNLISAFIKSLRGSDANAAFYYLARLLNSGDDPKFIARRMIIFASEDIGLAAPAALNLAVSTFLAVERVGLPEANYNLFHCAAVLAKAPKSRAVASAMQKALQVAESHPNASIPLHLRNAPTKLMRDLGYNKGYKWEAGYKDTRGFMPEELKDLNFFD
ncbi:replication-associated recombination protein A [Patescibacteria group bacterium]|nr:replication-associated recombination protein A [Patescibacteria group bacterium]